MKRLCYLALALMAVTAGCTQSKEQTSDPAKKETKQPIDSFTTADRAFADVRGLVNACTVTTTDMVESGDTLAVPEDALTSRLTQTFDADGHIAKVVREDMFMDQPVGTSTFTFEFSPDGQLTSSSTDLDGRFMVKRNADGYVTTFTSIGNNGDVDYTKVYTWKGNRLTSQQLATDYREAAEGVVLPIDKITYTYDDNGYRLTETEESGDPELEMHVTETTYKYSDFDDHGNWTRRDVSRTAKVYKVQPSRKRTLSDSIATYQTEVRVIDYKH